MGYMDITQALLSAGANVSLRCSSEDMSALDRAVELGHVDVARVIIEHGAGVNSAATDGRTPLHCATLAGKAEMVSMLLAKGAGVDTMDGREGCTPLMTAALKGHVDMARTLLSTGADVDLRSNSGRSALELAASAGHVGVLRAIVGHGAGVNSTGPEGISALHLFGRNREPGRCDRCACRRWCQHRSIA